jgi:hypothetical protein
MLYPYAPINKNGLKNADASTVPELPEPLELPDLVVITSNLDPFAGALPNVISVPETLYVLRSNISPL